MAATYYEVLGLTRDADPDVIKAAFRTLAKKHHPDHGGDSSVAKSILEAGQVLSEPEQRKAYDQSLKIGIGPRLKAKNSLCPQCSVVQDRLLARAEQGVAAFQAEIGLMYSRGEGFPLDPVKARKWLAEAANQRSPEGHRGLGHLYYRGVGLNQDLKRARHHYLKAAELGDALSQYNVALMFEQAEGGPRDLACAFRWYSVGAAADPRCESGRERVRGRMEGDELERAMRLVNAHHSA